MWLSSLNMSSARNVLRWVVTGVATILVFGLMGAATAYGLIRLLQYVNWVS